MANKEALALAAALNKKLGGDALLVASDIKTVVPFTTGSLSLDIAMGGGWPANQWSEVIGNYSNGKSFIIFKTIAANQARDPEFTVLWVASEKYDEEQATALGVDNNRVIVLSTNDMVVAFDAMIEFTGSRSVDCIVLDSYPALIPPEEENKDMEQVQVALGARTFGKFFRKVGSASLRSNTGPDRPFFGLIVNQWRDVIGWAPTGSPGITPGGKAKDYAFYARVEVKRDEWIEEKIPGKDMKIKVGQTVKVKTLKNKQAPPQQVASIELYFRDAPTLGFYRGEYDTVKEAVIMGLVYDLITRRGAYFLYGDERWLGRDALVQAFREQPDLLSRLDLEVREIALAGKGARLTEDDVSQAETEGTRTVSRLATSGAAT